VGKEGGNKDEKAFFFASRILTIVQAEPIIGSSQSEGENSLLHSHSSTNSASEISNFS